MSEEGVYDRRDLLRAFLAAEGAVGTGGYRPGATAYNEALKAYHRSMLDGLEQLFGLRLSHDGIPSFDGRVLFMMFSSTVRSYLSVSSPGSGFLEAGLLIRKLEEAGPRGARVLELTQHVGELAEQSRHAHLEILETLLELLLADHAELAFSSADLQRLGVADARPDPSDYPEDDY